MPRLFPEESNNWGEYNTQGQHFYFFFFFFFLNFFGQSGDHAKEDLAKPGYNQI
jgi:hypothetical protein